jgi:SAM-dependent methyltransferase
MAEQQIHFDDGAAYERSMGVWSRLAGQIFLEWLVPSPGLRWVDVGCGSGAFTELLIQHCGPAEVHGVDPSEGQLAFARTRPATRTAKFRQGDAMALPYADNSFDGRWCTPKAEGMVGCSPLSFLGPPNAAQAQRRSPSPHPEDGVQGAKLVSV